MNFRIDTVGMALQKPDTQRLRRIECTGEVKSLDVTTAESGGNG
jgi:hypothetical protein